MAQNVIPVVDLSKYVSGTPEEKKEFIQEVGKAFHEIGFLGITNHGIEPALIEEFYSQSKDFFSLPVDIKKKYEIEGLGGQRGYTPFGREHAKHSKVADLKEFFQIGQEVSNDHPNKADYPDNVEVDETPGFTPSGIKLYQAFEMTGGILLQAIAEHLDLPTDFFTRQIKDGYSILRTIHYPPITSEPDSAIRAEQHEDINLITLLVGASAGGLQILDMDGDWLDIIPESDEIVINVGDMLQRLTNNYLKSTTHRVVNPPREEWHLPRLSIPFFLHPVAEMSLACLDSCIDEDHPKIYEDMTAGEYLNQRLREIGLIK
jgi:isopenicillin N synthase-like dioxygenase